MSDPQNESAVPAAATPILLHRGSVRYCLRCHALLAAKQSCDRCGLSFDPQNPATYSTGARFVAWRYWFPGFLMAVACGVISYSIVFLSGEMGPSLFICVPVSFAAILGYGTRGRFWLILFLSIVAIGAVVFLIITMNIAGAFCGMTLAAIFVVPAALGAVFGWILNVILKNSQWDQRRYLPLIGFAILPLASALIEHLLPHVVEIATVQTEATFPVTTIRAWNGIMFYEQVEHEPPFLLKLALPRPIRAVGSMAAVGDVQRCIYQKGELVKEITRRDPFELLEFRVTEQHLHFEHDVTLIDGSFRLAPISADRTRVTLTTRYIRHLRPGWLWEPMERKIVHTLHAHVLEGMRRRAETDDQPERPEPSYPPPSRTPLLVQTNEESR